MTKADTWSLPSALSRSYFPLTAKLAEQIRKDFEREDRKLADLTEGMIFTDVNHPDEGRLRRDISVKSLLKRGGKQYDASYLINDRFNRKLYGQEQWRERIRHRLLRGADGQVLKENDNRAKKEAFNEFQVTVGWAEFTGEDGQHRWELWLVRPNNERWKLYEVFDEDKVGRSRRVSTTVPYYFIALPDGLIALAETDGSLARIFQNGRSVHQFPLTRISQAVVPDAEFKVAMLNSREEGETVDRLFPLFYYHQAEQKLVFAGWPASAPEAPAKLAPLEGNTRVNIYVMDLLQGGVDEVLTSVRMPFSLSASGIFLMEEPNSTKVWHRPIDLKTGEVGLRPIHPIRFESMRSYHIECFHNRVILVDKSGSMPARWYVAPKGLSHPVAADTSALRFKPLEEADLKKLEKMGFPPDLLHEALTGDFSPLYGNRQVTDDLVKVLGRLRNTWALLVYDKGERPDSLVASYLLSVDFGMAGAEENLLSTLNVPKIGPAYFLDGESAASYQETLTTLHSLTEGKRLQLYLSDFPSSAVLSRAEKTAKKGESLRSEKILAAWTELKKQFLRCAEQGTCRLITSIRRSTYEQLLQLDGSIFDGAEVVTVGELDKGERVAVGRNVANEVVREFEPPLTLSGTAVERAVYLFDQQRKTEMDGVKSVVASPGRIPGYYQTKFRDLFQFVQTMQKQKGAKGPAELTDSILEEYGRRVGGGFDRWHLEMRKEAGDEADDLYWVRRDEKDGEDKKKALSEAHHELWKNEPSVVAGCAACEYALVKVAKGKSTGQLDLISPQLKEGKALFTELPLEVFPLASGFFYLLEDGANLKLGFMKYDPANPYNRDEPFQRHLKTLKAGIPGNAWAQGDIEFIDGMMIVRSHGREEIYGPEGMYQVSKKESDR